MGAYWAANSGFTMTCQNIEVTWEEMLPRVQVIPGVGCMGPQLPQSVDSVGSTLVCRDIHSDSDSRSLSYVHGRVAV